MRFFAFLALIIGGIYYGQQHIQKQHAQGLTLLEQRANDFVIGLNEALTSQVEASPEEITEHLAKFTHPSGKIAGIPAVEFWLQAQEAGTLDRIEENSFTRQEYLFRAGPWEWKTPGAYTTVWAKNIGGNLGIGFLYAKTTARGMGIPSEATFDQLIRLMRQVDKINNTVLYHGKPLRVDISIEWVWKNNNWFIDPSKAGSLKVLYRPQQSL